MMLPMGPTGLVISHLFHGALPPGPAAWSSRRELPAPAGTGGNKEAVGMSLGERRFSAFMALIKAWSRNRNQGQQ